MGKTLPRIPIIAGATGTGKSEAAVIVAEGLEGEIVSADSRQVYRGVVIGTAAPGPDLQERIPHHLINVRDPREKWSAGEFADEAARCIGSIFERGNLPLVVGGSGFYIRALTEGLFEEPPVNDAERRRVDNHLRRRIEREGSRVLHSELAGVDPEWAASIPETDSQRIVRGLAVYELHGISLTELQKTGKKEPPFKAEWSVILLERDREDLYRRLNGRVVRLLDTGWLREARSLKSAGISGDAPGLSGLGYNLLFEHLEGRVSYDEAVERIQQEHRNYAKRQITWFKSLDAQRVRLEPADGPEAAAARILAVWNA